jgi:hypothetical protein
MGKYMSAIPASFLNLVAVKQSPYCRVIVGFRVIELLYKLFWDYIEDWALFYGGMGALEFKNKREKWQNKLICRRPSQFCTTTLVVAIIFNFCARSQWIFNEFSTMPCIQSFWYKTAMIFLEITRRCLWNILRVDNQQATNCEEYALTRVIPVLIS